MHAQIVLAKRLDLFCVTKLVLPKKILSIGILVAKKSGLVNIIMFKSRVFSYLK